MKYLKFFSLILFFLSVSCDQKTDNNRKETKIKPEIKDYVDFLNNQHTSAKDYILTLFNKYDIVILSERAHYEYTQYNTILNIISDKRFIDSVGTVFVEVGVSSEQNKVNEFLKSENLREKEIKQKTLEIYRNIPFFPNWDKTSYYDFLIQLYKINQKLTSSEKVDLYYSDVPFSWKETKTKKEYQEFIDTLETRDSVIAQQIIFHFEKDKNSKKRKKALIILNYRHAFINIRYTKNGQKTENVGRYLKEKYGNQVVSILINDINNKNNKFFPYHHGKWDASFELLNISNIGFDFKQSPFGKDSFDMYPVKNDLTYNDVFSGFIYTAPMDSFIFKKGVPNYISDDFKKEYIRRNRISGYHPDIENDTINRTWMYSEKRWCSNYDAVRYEINQWKTYNNTKKQK